MKNVLCYIFCLLAFTMCENHTKGLLLELSKAESLMQQNPDSALKILDLMTPPSHSDKLQYATWCLLMTQAHDKNEIKHTSDSLINIALAYFEKEKDPERKATTLYYGGRVNYDLDRIEEATKFYLRAQDAVCHTDNYKLYYLINTQLGSMYIFRGLKENALDAYQTAYENAVLLNDSSLISYSLSFLARIYSASGSWEKAVVHYKDAIAVAEESDEQEALGCAFNELSAVYTQMYRLDSSIFYAQKALDIKERMQDANLPQSYLVMGRTYELLGQPDLSEVYLKKAIQGGNMYTVTSAYQSLYELNKKRGNCEAAVIYNDLYWSNRDSLGRVNRSMKVAEIQAKYDHEKLENANNQLIIEKNRVEKSALFILIIFLVVISIVVFVYQRKLLRKEHAIRRTKEQLQSHLLSLHENEVVIHQNEELIESLSSQLQENNDWQDHIEDQMAEIERIRQKNEYLQTQNKLLQGNIEKYTRSLQNKGLEMKNYEQLTRQNSLLQDRERFLCNQLIRRTDVLNQLKYTSKCVTDIQWVDIIEAIDLIYDHFTARLREEFPTLTESDIQICCLLKLHLSNSTIATLSGISPSSVTKRKQRMKERINQSLNLPLDKEFPIESYLLEY